jgi:hypothetical protein
MANIKNLSEFPVQIGSVRISSKATALVARWNILQHSDNVKSLLNADVIEVAAEEEAPKAKAGKKGSTDGVSGTDAINV